MVPILSKEIRNRLSQGVYLYPNRNQYGVHKPTEYISAISLSIIT